MIHAAITIDQVKSWEKEDRLKEWTTSESYPDTIDDQVIAGAITRANAEIYTKLAGRYKFPLEIFLTDTAEIEILESALHGIEFTITRYFLSSRVNVDTEMKDVYVQYNKAMKTLNDVATGGASLYGLVERTASPVSLSLGLVTNKTDTDQDFTSDILSRMTY